MTYFPKMSYWKTLVTNDKSAEKITNPDLKNPRAPHVA